MARITGPVAFQGERGAFSEVAVRQLVGERAKVLPCQRFADVFAKVAAGDAPAAVVPIENSLHGSVHENYDHLIEYELSIVAETQLRIVHNLISAPGVSFRQIRRVYSHPVALNQCQRFFSANPQITPAPFYDTAGSVKMLMEENPEAAGAIAAAVAADIYGGRVLKRSIEDDPQNFTRFFLLVPKKKTFRTTAKGEWKTSLVFGTRNTPGALFRALSAFALRDLSLTKIESRPLRGRPWEYLFYLDFLGHPDDPPSARALGHLAELADDLRILGTYPRMC